MAWKLDQRVTLYALYATGAVIALTLFLWNWAHFPPEKRKPFVGILLTALFMAASWPLWAVLGVIDGIGSAQPWAPLNPSNEVDKKENDHHDR